eukprot:2598580-Rhodomonas_salina.2
MPDTPQLRISTGHFIPMSESVPGIPEQKHRSQYGTGALPALHFEIKYKKVFLCLILQCMLQCRTSHLQSVAQYDRMLPEQFISTGHRIAIS